MVTTITSSAPYSSATASRPARTVAGSPATMRRRRAPSSPCASRKRSAFSTGGTGIGRPRTSIAKAMRCDAVRRSASSPSSAQSAHTATAVRGAASRCPGSNSSR